MQSELYRNYLHEKTDTVSVKIATRKQSLEKFEQRELGSVDLKIMNYFQ